MDCEGFPKTARLRRVCGRDARGPSKSIDRLKPATPVLRGGSVSNVMSDKLQFVAGLRQAKACRTSNRPTTCRYANSICRYANSLSRYATSLCRSANSLCRYINSLCRYAYSTCRYAYSICRYAYCILPTAFYPVTVPG